MRYSNFTGDEERPGEPLSIARRSAYHWTLATTGKTAHSSGIFGKEAGEGAIYEMARILYRFEQELRDPGLTYNVGLIFGVNGSAL